MAWKSVWEEEDEDEKKKKTTTKGWVSVWSGEDEEEESVEEPADKIFASEEEKPEKKEQPKKEGFWQRAKEKIKGIFDKEESVQKTKQEKIESVYNQRDTESVKHSAEIEIADIDQRIQKLEADQKVVAEYMRYASSEKPWEKGALRVSGEETSLLNRPSPEDAEMKKGLEKRLNEISQEYLGKPTAEPGYMFNTLQKYIDDLKGSKEQLAMVVENQEKGASNKFTDALKEVVPGFKDLSNVPFGAGALISFATQLEENKVSKKIDKGEKLTPEEEVVKKRIIAKEEYEKRGISDLQAAFQSIPSSLSMSADFLLIGLAGGGTAGLKGLPKYLKEGGKATKVAFTTQLPRMLEQFADRVNGEYETVPTKDGGFELVKVKEGEVPLTAAILSVGNVWANSVVEAVGGELLDDALGVVFKPLTKKLPEIKISSAIKESKAFKVIQKLYKSETLKEYFARQSLLGELFEEFTQSQIDKITYGEPLGLTGEEAKRITLSTLIMSLIMSPLGLVDLKNGESKRITNKDLEKLPDGLRKEVEQELGDKEAIDKEDLKNISQNIVDKIESGEIEIQLEKEEEVKTEAEEAVKEASEEKEVEGLVGENQKRFTYKGYEFITTEFTPRATPGLSSLDTSKKVLNLYGQTEDGWTFVENKSELGEFADEQLDSFINKYKDRLVKSTTIENVSKLEEKVKSKTSTNEVYYHGTAKEFSQFDKSKIGSGIGWNDEGPGIYLTESPVAAQEFANVAARKKALTKDIGMKTVNKKTGAVLEATLKKGTKILDFENLKLDAKRAKEILKKAGIPDKTLKSISDKEIDSPQKLINWLNLSKSIDNSYKFLTEQLGYDGIRLTDPRWSSFVDEMSTTRNLPKEIKTIVLYNPDMVLISKRFTSAKGASIDLSSEEKMSFLKALKEFRTTKNNSVEKADAINTALKEISPAIAPNHVFTQEEVKERAGRVDTISALELPEIVRIVNSLSDTELLTVVKKIKSSSMARQGQFVSGGVELRIDVLASLFADPQVAAKTVAHEIGHFVDYLPDGKMAGTFASKIAGVKNLAKNFGEFKNSTMREEIYTLSRDVWRPFPEEIAPESYLRYRKEASELYADFISMLFVDPVLLKQRAPQTLNAWITFMQNKPEVKKAFEEAWDLMLATGDELYDKRAKSIREMFNEGDNKLWGLGEISEFNKREKASSFLVKAWKGTKEMVSDVERVAVDVKTPLKEIESKAQKRLGRKLTTEEKISKQVESLQRLQAEERAYIDTFYDPIKRRLDAEGLSWDLLAEYQFLNRIVKERGDITPQEALESLEDVSLLDLFTEDDKQDINFQEVLKNIKEEDAPMLTSFIEKSVKNGDSISTVINNLVNGVYKTLFGEKGPTTKPEVMVRKTLDEGGLAKRLSTYLPLKAGVANPLGFTTDTAQAQIDYMKRQLGDTKFETLKQIAEKDFRAGSLALLQLEGAQDYFGESRIEQIKKNEAYVTFAVNYYLDKYIPPTIRRQVGTLKGVANVATATALKNTSLLRAIEQNTVRKNAIDFIRKNEPESLKQAPLKYDASLGYQVVDYKQVAKMKGWELLSYMDEGQLRQVLVPTEIYNAITERIADGNIAPLRWLEVLNNKYYRPILVVRNFAYNLYNIPRDFLRYWKHSYWMTLPESMYYYAKALPQSAKSVFSREDSETIREMKSKRMLGFYRNDIYDNPSSKTSAKLFELYETKAGTKEGKTLMDKIHKLWNIQEQITEVFEMTPKVAGKLSLDQKKIFENDAEVRDMIVNYLGSPNFKNKGEWYKYYNNIFLFSNAMKEGWKGDLEVLSGKTPAGKKGAFVSTLRTIEATVIPVVLGYMIRSGMPPFDDDDKWGDIRRLLEKIPKRDFLAFLPIPLGEVGGKAIYTPVARADADQLVAAVVWALMDEISDAPGKESLFTSLTKTFFSEFPSLNPLFESANAIFTAASGENPYDSFRGRNVFNPYTFNTMTGEEKAKELLEYLAGLNGLSVIVRTYDPRTYGEERTPIEKAHQIPVVGNVIYRLLRVSNYGTIETFYQEKLEEERENARLKKERDLMINEDARILIENNASIKEIDNKLKEYEEAAIGYPRPKEGYKGDDKEISNQLRKKLKEELLKESGKLPSWRILDMNTNRDKKNLLLQQRENMSDEQFINYLKNLRNYEIISDEFVKTLSEEGYITKMDYKNITKGDRFKFHPF